jgi:hypothetical protein
LNIGSVLRTPRCQILIGYRDLHDAIDQIRTPPGVGGAIRRRVDELIADMGKLLDVVEFAEGALIDHVAREEGCDVRDAWRVLKMCSDAIVKHGRTSVLVESRKQPDS